MSINETLMILAFSTAVALVVVKFLFAYLLIRKYNSNKEFQMLLGAFLLFLFLGIGRIIMMVFDYGLTHFDPNLLQPYTLFWKIGSLVTWGGFFCFILVSEKSIFMGKTRYIISILYLALIIISLIPTDFLLSQTVAGIPTGIAIFFIPVSYIYLIFKTSAEPRKKAVITLIGFFVYFCSYFLLAEGVTIYFSNLYLINSLSIKYLLHVISASTKMVGIYLLYLGFVKEKEED